MASGPQSEPPNNGLFVWGLGLIVGLVICFVVMLSLLPVDIAENEAVTETVRADADSYQFYSVLPSETSPQIEAAVREVAPKPVQAIPPATRVVPGSVQSLSARSLPEKSLGENPVKNIAQEKYFLQAGNYRVLEEAEKQRASLLLIGLEAFIVARQDSDGSIGHRVRIGPFVDPDRIAAAKDRLKRNSISYKLIRVTS